MRDLLFILITLVLTTCHNASYNQEEGNVSAESFRNKNDTSSSFFNGGAGFMSDSRFGRGGSATSGYTFSSATARSRIVETKYGRVQGLSVTLFSNMHLSGSNRNFPLKNKIVEIFFSIPYAAPPIKSHRFSPTQTPIPWNDVRPATQPSAVCPQIFPDIKNESAALKEMPKGYLEYLRRIEPYLRNQSEDCLYLNIFSPIGSDPTKLKPIVVFIHGGMFAWGSGNLSDGTVLAAYADVIFVSLNYRLSILGFLNLNESPTTKPRVANYGLMDQIAALHWIKENIVKFGGDPNNISMLGYEAGAACINFLMSSPTVTPGLFHRSILISGSMWAPWALIPDPSEAAFRIAESLNCSANGTSSSGNNTSGTSSTTTTTPPSRESHHFGISSTTNSDEILSCLRGRHFTDFTSKSVLPKFSVDFGPSVDGIVIKPNFRSSLPSQMKRETNRKYDVLFGLSSMEKLIELSEMDLEFGFEYPRRDAILRTLVRNSYKYHRNEILAVITNEYTDFERSVTHPISTRDLTVNAVTDCLSLAPVASISESSLIKRSFFYVFDVATRDGLYNYQKGGGTGGGGGISGGGGEIPYFFGMPLVETLIGSVLPFTPQPLPSNFSKSEQALSELLLRYLGNFVHTGDPNGQNLRVSTFPVSKEKSRYKNTEWEPYSKIHQKYLEIDVNKIRTRSHYRAHQMAVWLRLIPQLERTGAQMASTHHNRMRGGNDPTLYAGRLKQPEEETEDTPELTGASSLNFAQLYDILLGYSGGSAGDIASLPELVETDDIPEGGDKESFNKSPTLSNPCFSPVSVHYQTIKGRTFTGSELNNTGNHNQTISSFFDSTQLSPTMILAIIIIISCSLLFVNISIYLFVFFQRKKRRGGKFTTTQQQQDSEQDFSKTSNKYSEPPELLKSNRTTASSFLQNSHSQGQLLQAELEALELTVKLHQQELLGEKALLGRESLSGDGASNSESSSFTPTDYVRQSILPKQQQQLPHSYSTQNLVGKRDHFPDRVQQHNPVGSTTSQRGVVLSPSDYPSKVIPSQTLAVSTLPRCNGSLAGGSGLSSFISLNNKPAPPPRSATNFSTLPHPLRREKRIDYGDNYNSDSNNETDELKV